MGKYYLYNGKRVGFVRKAIDEVVLVEEGWISEVQNHFGKKTHDQLLQHFTVRRFDPFNLECFSRTLLEALEH